MNADLKKFFTSLANATLILLIVATCLILFAIHKAQTFTNSVLSDVTVQLLEKAHQEIKSVAVGIRSAEKDLKSIVMRLNDLVKHPEVALKEDEKRELEALTQELNLLRRDVVKLNRSGQALSDQAIRELASIAAQTIIDIRHCRAQREN